MRGQGKHLSWNDRLIIEKMLREGYSKPQIARYLGVHHSTIYEEVKRGEVELVDTHLVPYKAYSPEKAEQYHERKKKNMEKPLKIGDDRELAKFIVNKISDGFSPAAVCSLLGKSPETTFSVQLSRNTIYKYIEEGYLWPLTNKQLRYKGQRRKKHRKVRVAKRASAGDSIEKRPTSVNARTEFGHWEMDSVIGKRGSKKTCLVLTERLSRKEIVLPMKDHTAESVVKSLDRLERNFGVRKFSQVFKTITVDNGSEFADVVGMQTSDINGAERTHIYYCHPRNPGERGSNEKQNQLIRWFFPKGTDFRKVSNAELQKAVDWINNYPRQLLGWRTANQIFEEHMKLIS